MRSDRTEELAADEHEWVGPGTHFLGEVHGGDFYNRYPVGCRLVGTRRWAPGNTLAEVEEEQALLAPIAVESGCDRPRPATRARGAEIDPGTGSPSPARRTRCHGQELPLTGVKVVRTVRCSTRRDDRLPRPDGDGARGRRVDEVAELVRATQVYLALLERLWA
jgi:hypothetical protein